MAKLGRKLKKREITNIYLIHGTFMGDDPFDIFRLSENLVPFVPKKIKKKVTSFLKRRLKNNRERLFNDLADFTDEYTKLLDESLGSEIEITNYNWNSANHHLGRIKGALGLLDCLYEHSNPNRVLLIGHSHAGQLFALLTQFLSPKQNLFKTPELLDYLKEAGEEFKDFEKKIEKVRNLKFDIVTLGMPPRYSFYEGPNINILHLINHRRKDHLAGMLTGALFSKEGDYIQQWAIPGSDSISPILKENLINTKLDEILGTGLDMKIWRKNLKKRKRIPNQGYSYLINYGDSSKWPNFLKTIFGHGVYTRKEHLLFHIYLIEKYFYEGN